MIEGAIFKNAIACVPAQNGHELYYYEKKQNTGNLPIIRNPNYLIVFIYFISRYDVYFKK